MPTRSDSAIELAALELLEAALDLPPPAREAYIASRQDCSAAVRERALELLLSDRDAIAGLQTGGAGASLYGRSDTAPDIPGYRVIRQLGRGGMGAVWLAERDADDFEHLVAIKIIKPGALSESLVERFRRERQILAQLNHPNIARLYDGGQTEENQPYIVMEHVAGETLRDWLNQDPAPSLDRRIALFQQVAAAVGFAHQNLVVHRDLTPGNILVDDRGQAKLIDFGIARPPRTTDAPSKTSGVSGLSLTPGFAAPERALGEGSNTLADVYSLGRILRLMIDGYSAPELSAIAARASARAPENRYPSAGEMSEDVDRLINGRTIDTYSTSRRYRLGKFVRRQKMLVASGGALVLAISLGLAATSWFYVRAEAARGEAEQRFGEVRELANFMLFDLDEQLQRTSGNTAARTGLVAAAQEYLSALAASRTMDSGLQLEAARGFNRLAQVQGSPVVPNLGQVDEAKVNLAAARKLLLSLPMESVGAQIARAHNDLHRAMIALHADADQDGAVRMMKEAQDALASTSPVQRSRAWRLARAELLLGEAEVLTVSGEAAALEQLVDRIDRELDAWPPSERAGRDAGYHRAHAEFLRGRALNLQFREADSLPHLRAAEQRFLGLDREYPNDPLVLNALMWAAYEGYNAASAVDLAESARFLSLTRKTVDRLTALESADQSLRSFAINVRQAQAEALGVSGNHAAAIALQREVIAGREAAAGRTPDVRSLSRLAVSNFILGHIALAAGERLLACRSYRQSGQAWEKARALGPLVGINEERADQVRQRESECERGAPLKRTGAP